MSNPPSHASYDPSLDFRAAPVQRVQHAATSGPPAYLSNPATLAVIGAVLSFITGAISTVIHLRTVVEAETAKAQIAEQARKNVLQTELIKHFIEHPDPKFARDNLLFLAHSGLLPDYGDRIAALLKANPGLLPHIAPRARATEPTK